MRLGFVINALSILPSDIDLSEVSVAAEHRLLKEQLDAKSAYDLEVAKQLDEIRAARERELERRNLEMAEREDRLRRSKEREARLASIRWPTEKQRRSRTDWGSLMPAPNKMVEWERTATMVAMRAEGLSADYIADRFGLTAASVYRRVKDHTSTSPFQKWLATQTNATVAIVFVHQKPNKASPWYRGD